MSAIDASLMSELPPGSSNCSPAADKSYTAAPRPILSCTTGNWITFPRVLGRNAAQDCCAQRGRVHRGVGRE
eukprot:3565103-Alexandrium_andersonii.AAC.1